MPSSFMPLQSWFFWHVCYNYEAVAYILINSRHSETGIGIYFCCLPSQVLAMSLQKWNTVYQLPINLSNFALFLKYHRGERMAANCAVTSTKPGSFLKREDFQVLTIANCPFNNRQYTLFWYKLMSDQVDMINSLFALKEKWHVSSTFKDGVSVLITQFSNIAQRKQQKIGIYIWVC